MSNAIVDGNFAAFVDVEFSPLEDMPSNIPLLNNLSNYYENETNLAFLDTEGLDYQTELGDNYDVVTLLPHTVIAENVFLIVRDRVNPAEVIEVIEKLATAAERTNGTLSYRDGKLFGRFTIIVNKSQDISKSDEEELQLLKQSNPSLINRIEHFFTYGPEIILLPFLQWNYEDEPDFNEDGFYIDYELIRLAHPPRRDRMLYGLHKIADFILRGISIKPDYSISCESFETMLQQLYSMTTEDVIDIISTI